MVVFEAMPTPCSSLVSSAYFLALITITNWILLIWQWFRLANAGGRQLRVHLLEKLSISCRANLRSPRGVIAYDFISPCPTSALKVLGWIWSRVDTSPTVNILLIATCFIVIFPPWYKLSSRYFICLMNKSPNVQLMAVNSTGPDALQWLTYFQVQLGSTLALRRYQLCTIQTRRAEHHVLARGWT